MKLNCTYQFTNPQEQTITVGELFEAHCKIDSSIATGAPAAEPAPPVDLTKLKVKFEEGKNYDLIVVRSAHSGDDINFALTSYVVGAKNMDGFNLTDGQAALPVTTPLRFEVKSILKPEDKPEMFGPISGIPVTIPLFYWILLAAFLFFGVSGTIGALYRRMKRKKLMKRLEALDDGTVPIQQYFTYYRKLQRENAIYSARSDSKEIDPTIMESMQPRDELLRIVVSVEHSLRLYIARTFRIASLEIPWKSTWDQLNKYHDLVYALYGVDLKELSNEFQKVESGKNKLEAKDVILISEKSRKWIEKADQLHKAILAKDTLLIKKLRGAK